MSSKQSFRILIIDDNAAIHQDFIKILSTSLPSELDTLSVKIFGKHANDLDISQHFEIDTAMQGEEGVERIKLALAENRPYALAFVDIRMPPGWDGIETIKHIWEIDKDIQIVICTAYSDYSWEETVAHLGKTDNLLILKKPFDNISVRQLACALTKKWQLLQETRGYMNSLKQQVDERTFSLQNSLSLVKATLESSHEGILVVNESNRVVDFNRQLMLMWQIPQDIMDSGDESIVLTFMKDQLENPSEFFDKKMLHTRNTITIDVIKFKDGRVFECYSQPQLLDDEIVGHVLNFRDVTKGAKLESDLHYQATHDALTELPNRILLLDKLKKTIRSAEESNLTFAVMFLDLNRFKLINDSLNHTVGDQLLIAVAKRLRASLRSDDLLARLGGDEFVIVLTKVNGNEQIAHIANHILSTFQEPFHLGNRNIMITSSCGISIYPKDGTSADVLLRNADVAMYRGKEINSNHFQFYSDEMSKHSIDKLDKEIQLRQALGNNEFYVCYQPQYDIENATIIAVEALLRWKNPLTGEMLPLDFIPLAEETGLIVPIGEWMLRTVCMQNKAWQDQGYQAIRVAVNISAQQLKQNNFVEMVQEILKETKLKPQYLELEMTENIVISNLEVLRKISLLKEIGVNIAIDDFGTGYSSLSYLKKLTLDRLKIDGSFIKHIKSNDDDEAIVRAIIAVAKNLNLEVLAEGVETQIQLDFLKENKCDEIQGYFYSKPLLAKDMELLLKQTNGNKHKLTTE